METAKNSCAIVSSFEFAFLEIFTRWTFRSQSRRIAKECRMVAEMPVSVAMSKGVFRRSDATLNKGRNPQRLSGMVGMRKPRRTTQLGRSATWYPCHHLF